MLVLLPGLDGTGQLAWPFLRLLPRACPVISIQYPTDLRQTYSELEQLARQRLPREKPFILIAESFSGPIALRLAAQCIPNLQAVVLISSFAFQPLGPVGNILARLPLEIFFRAQLPKALLRAALLGWRAPNALAAFTAETIHSVKPRVLSDRIRQALTSDLCTERVHPHTRVIALHSRNDRLLGKHALRSILKVCPQAETHQLDAPHLTLAAAPDCVYHHLCGRGFLI